MGGNLKTTAEMKETMADALIRLLAEKPIGKITVPEIVDLAGVGRMSYFRNFSSKEEMITYKLIRLWNRWADENQLSERSSYTLENAYDFFAFNWSIRPLLCLIYRHNLQSAMYEAFYQIMAPKQKSNAAKAYRSRFYSYGLFGLLDEWIKRDFQESPEEMVDIIYKISRP